MCQAEVAHHANRIPQRFVSRRLKDVRLYRQVLAMNSRKKPSEDEAENDVQATRVFSGLVAPSQARTTTPTILDVKEEFEETSGIDRSSGVSFHGKYGEGFVPSG